MRAQRLLDLEQGLDSGIYPDLNDLADFLWADARNIVFGGRAAKKMRGWAKLVDAYDVLYPVPIRGLAQTRLESGVKVIYSGDAGNLYRIEGDVLTRIGQSYTGIVDETSTQPATRWVIAPYGNWMIATNGIDPVQVYKGVSCEALTGTTFSKARIIKRFGARVIALNTSNGENWVEWCSADNIELWAPATDNSAGNLPIRDMDGGILAAEPLGNRLAIYSKDQLFLMNYIGPPFYYGIDLALNGIGALSTAAVVSVGRQNYGISGQGFWKTDGVNYQYLDIGSIHDWFFSRLNAAQVSKICGFHDELNTQIIWFYPSGTSLEPNEGVGFNYVTNQWTAYGFGRTSAIEKQVFDYPILADALGTLYKHNLGVDADGAPLTAYVETKFLDMGDTDQNKFFDYLKLGLKKAEGVTLKVSIRDRLPEEEDVLEWLPEQAVDVTAAPIYIGVSGRYIKLKFIISGLEGDINLQAILGYGQPGGEWQ